MDETITIPVTEYKKLLETSVRVEIFSKFVNDEEYSISREHCGKYLGFEIENKEE